ncbi:formin [Raphidocelis subcapitata]|uniref:Formin n=1 Tax=Raphidocelis subcapitata TaxID=307507 RepID=A0A2V0NW49_9CHLO|nr:formin [Raphidocelis subcapitata]|eukprot:GBF91864.1 formin [Raphidocelis subcapitata]
MKTKGGHSMNPADAFRKAERKKEIARNKAERQFIRSAFGRRDKPQELREELKELIELEQEGPLSKLQKIRKKVLQEAYDTALKRQKEEEFKKKHEQELQQQLAEGTVMPEEVHPPPKGVVGPAGGMPAVPLPKLPPLPAGPLPPSEAALSAAAAAAPLPPPPYPPPGRAPLMPPPPYPPPGFGGMAAAAAGGRLAPPPGPPPVYMPPPGGAPPRLPPPSAPPPGGAGAGAVKSAAAATISGASTVAKRPLAHKDKTLTSMVPASVRVRREEAPKPKPDALRPAIGFGLAPVQRPAAAAPRPLGLATPGGGAARPPSQAGAGTGGMDSKLADFMASLEEEALL